MSIWISSDEIIILNWKDKAKIKYMSVSGNVLRKIRVGRLEKYFILFFHFILKLCKMQKDQCPFISQCKKKKCTSILKFMLKRQIIPKSGKKNQCQFFDHVTGVFHWKIFAMVFLCFIAGEWHRSVNITNIIYSLPLRYLFQVCQIVEVVLTFT